jgi:hypothetical protein
MDLVAERQRNVRSCEPPFPETGTAKSYLTKEANPKRQAWLSMKT